MITGINFSHCLDPTRIEWDSAIVEVHDYRDGRYSNNWCILHNNTARMDEEFHTAAFHLSP